MLGRFLGVVGVQNHGVILIYFDLAVVTLRFKILSGNILETVKCGKLKLGVGEVCSPAKFETCFSYDNDIWIATTDYYMYFYIIMLFSMRAVLQLMNVTAL